MKVKVLEIFLRDPRLRREVSNNRDLYESFLAFVNSINLEEIAEEERWIVLEWRARLQ